MKSDANGNSAGDTKIMFWQISIVLVVAIHAVASVLLWLIARTLDEIESGSAEIWRLGKLVAGNTVHVPLLARINHTLEELLETTGDTERATGRMSRSATTGNSKRS